MLLRVLWGLRGCAGWQVLEGAEGFWGLLCAAPPLHLPAWLPVWLPWDWAIPSMPGAPQTWGS